LLYSSSAVLLAEVASLPSLCDRAIYLTTQRAGALLEQYFLQSRITRDGGILQASGCSPALMNEHKSRMIMSTSMSLDLEGRGIADCQGV